MSGGDGGPHLARTDNAHQVRPRGRRNGRGPPAISLHQPPHVLQGPQL